MSHPGWPFKIPERVARWILTHGVDTIKYKWAFTSEDESKDWIELWSDKEHIQVQTSFNKVWPEIRVTMGPRMVEFKSWIDVAGHIQMIDKYNDKEARDRREYERLKEKFRDGS